MRKNVYFMKIPNSIIQTNIGKYYNLPKCYYSVYFNIGRNRTIEDKSWLIIGEIFKIYNQKMDSHKPKLFHDIINCLKYMEQKEMIKINTDLSFVKYDTHIYIEINAGNFDVIKNFTDLQTFEYETIFHSNTTLDKNNLLIIYLYVKSRIIRRAITTDGYEVGNPHTNPEAFYRSNYDICSSTGLSKQTITNCLKFLTSDECKLLIKGECKYGVYLGSESNKIRKIPNIYVLNNENALEEIDGAIKQLTSFYRNISNKK